MEKTVLIQCVSTKCGLHKSLEIGKWYEAFEHTISVQHIFDIDIETDSAPARSSQYSDGWAIRFGTGEWEYEVYDKSLFRTLDERREQKLEKLGI